MNAREAMQARRHPLSLVIFDCDGVLIDSEAVASRVVAEELTILGWPMDEAASQRRFMGMTLTDMEPSIVTAIGHAIPDGWRARLMSRMVEALDQEAQLVPGAIAAIDGVEALGLPWRIASNSSHAEMAAKFARTGLIDRARGRTHSHRDVGRGKPAPDIFLAAAAAQGVPPAECVVIEDSVPGTMAARAAMMDCLGYAPHGSGAELRAQGAFVFTSMFDVPDLLALATRITA